MLAYLVTGILAGPQVFGLIHSEDTLQFLSKLGITSLLFIVGSSLSPKVIREVGGVSAAAGIGQVVFTAFFGYLLALLFGYGWIAAAYIAIALTFSSTIVVLKSLQDRRELGTSFGKISIGILLVQDVVATLVLVMVTALSAGATDIVSFVVIFLKALLLGVSVAIVSRLLMIPLTKVFASSQEFLLLFSIAWGTGVAAIFQYAGFSIEIGALVAGVTLSSSPYHLEISSKMKILRDFLVAIFFIVLGSELQFGNIGPVILPAIVFALFVLIGNPIILASVMGFMGYGRNVSFRTGLAMAQISEFSLVLTALAYQVGHIDESVVLLVTIVAMITFVISSYMLMGSDWLTEKLWDRLAIFERKRVKKEHHRIEHVEAILFGCHRLGEDMLPFLQKTFKKYLVVDYDPSTIENLRQKNIRALYGDANDNEFVDDLGFDKVKLILSTLPDLDSNLFLLSKLRRYGDHSIAIMMAHSADEAYILYKAGANYVVLPHYLGGSYATLLLDRFGLDRKKFDVERKTHLEHLHARNAHKTERLPARAARA